MLRESVPKQKYLKFSSFPKEGSLMIPLGFVALSLFFAPSEKAVYKAVVGHLHGSRATLVRLASRASDTDERHKCPTNGLPEPLYLMFSRIFVRYFFMPSASLLVMISNSCFSSTRIFSTCAGVRGLKRISCSR